MGMLTRILIILGALVALFFFFFASDRKKQKKQQAQNPKQPQMVDLRPCPECGSYVIEKCKEKNCPV